MEFNACPRFYLQRMTSWLELAFAVAVDAMGRKSELLREKRKTRKRSVSDVGHRSETARRLPVSGDDGDDDHPIEYYSVNYYFRLNLYSVYFDC